MLSSSIPAKFNIPFANSAVAPFVRTVPEASQIGITPGAASLTDGFPPLNFDQIAAGGIPPWGADMNGLLKLMTSWLQWVAAGGIPVAYDATFSARIGGYPAGALLQSSTAGHMWLSTADNNLTNPNTGGAGWTAFPDALIQIQGGNFAVDAGSVNAVSVTLWPQPASWASIKGSPIRFMAAFANTVVNPTIAIVGLAGTKTMINSDGSPLKISQISRADQMCEGFYDGTSFQLTSPGPTSSAASQWITGVIYEWSNEVVPVGTLECNGAEYLITSYPNLFNVIGWRYGGDGASTFRVPDKRGAFTRGWDHGRGLDPDASTRTSSHIYSGSGTGAVTGDHVGTWQAWGLGPFTCTAALNNPVENWTVGWNYAASPNNYLLPGSAPLAIQVDSALAVAGGAVGAPTQSLIANLVTSIGSLQIQNGQPPNTFEAVRISSLSGTIVIGGTAGDTRPVNIDMMYIIAY